MLKTAVYKKIKTKGSQCVCLLKDICWTVIFLLPLVVKSWITLETIHWLDSYHHYMVNTEHRLSLFDVFSHLCDSHQFCKQSKIGLLDQTVKSWQEKLKTCFL